MTRGNTRDSGGETGGPTATASAAATPGTCVVHAPARTASEKKRSAAAAAAQRSGRDGGTYDERLKRKLASAEETGGGAAAGPAAATAALHCSRDRGTFEQRLKKKLAASAAETGGGAAAPTGLKPGAFAANEPSGAASDKQKAAAAAGTRRYSHVRGTFEERLKRKLAAAAETNGGAAASTGLKPGVCAVNEPAGTASEKEKVAAAAAARHSSLGRGTFKERLRKKLASSAAVTGGGAAVSTGLTPGVCAVNEPAGTATEKKKAAAAVAARHSSLDGGTFEERLMNKLASSATETGGGAAASGSFGGSRASLVNQLRLSVGALATDGTSPLDASDMSGDSQKKEGRPGYCQVGFERVDEPAPGINRNWARASETREDEPAFEADVVVEDSSDMNQSKPRLPAVGHDERIIFRIILLLAVALAAMLITLIVR